MAINGTSPSSLSGEFAATKESVIELCGDITEATAYSVIGELRANPGIRKTLIINSDGGSIRDGFSIIDTMLQVMHSPVPTPVHTHVTGKATGIAAAIAMAGDYRTISKYASIKLDAPYPGFWGAAHKFEIWLEEMAEQRNMLAEFFEARCLKAFDKEGTDTLIKNSRSISGIRATELGFFHAVAASATEHSESAINAAQPLALVVS